ncbi:hypothetical protein NDI47_10620 [Microcoleus vaginatus GB1-A2]|uniref:hypothetical protein n=1 Tax=Microcoleus vaginatus TaxID=119532 RepID=UPI001682CD3C|nr:hypothetical protein [Microcoleus sp. FACHB-61]
MQCARTDTGQRQLAEIKALLEEAVQLVYHSRRSLNSRFNVIIYTNAQSTMPSRE